jgi:hypothetical protein
MFKIYVFVILDKKGVYEGMGEVHTQKGSAAGECVCACVRACVCEHVCARMHGCLQEECFILYIVSYPTPLPPSSTIFLHFSSPTLTCTRGHPVLL